MKAGRKIWTDIWRWGLCLLLLAWIFHNIFLTEGRRVWEAQGYSWNELGLWQQWEVGWSNGPLALGGTLSLITPSAFLLSLLAMGMTVFLGMLRWQRVLKHQGFNLPFARTAEISLVAHFFNSLLLGSTGGDLFKAYFAARETHHKKTEAVTTVLADRLLGLFAMLLFACLMMLPNYALLSGNPRLTALAGFVLLMFLGCSVVVFIFFWGGLSRKIPQLRRWLRELPKGDLLERGLEACRHLGRHPLVILQLLGMSMALNVFCVFQIMALAWGLNVSLSPLVLFVVVPVIVSISALPITPSGLGVRENLYVWMLAVPAIHVAETRALALSLLAYAGFLFWSILGGIVYAARKQKDRLAEFKEPDALPENL